LSSSTPSTRFPGALEGKVWRAVRAGRDPLRGPVYRLWRPLGVDGARYGEILYGRTQAIGDAANFLGFDGLIAPNARWPCQNLVIFIDRLAPADLAIRSSAAINWTAWRKTARRQRSR
jgi:hypothetical protein